MKNKIKILLTFMMLLTAFVLTSGVSAFAAEKTYTVTVRAGNVGDIDTARVVAGSDVEVTENYLRFTVNKGESLSSAGIFASDDELNAFLHNIVSVGSDYMLLNVAGICDEEVTKNTEYVLDYARLVDPVPYSVYYVDAASGEQIAAPTMAYGNVGDEITDIAPVAVDGYTTTDKAVSLTLNGDGENTVTFKYTSTYVAGTVTQVVTVTTPGDVVTVVQNVSSKATADEDGTAEQPADASAANTTVAAAGAANAGGNAADAGQAGNDAAVQGADADNADQGEAQISDEDVPLGAGGSDDATSIEDEEVPLGAESAGNSGYYIAGLLAILAAVIAAVCVAVKKRGKNEVE